MTNHPFVNESLISFSIIKPVKKIPTVRSKEVHLDII